MAAVTTLIFRMSIRRVMDRLPFFMMAGSSSRSSSELIPEDDGGPGVRLKKSLSG
jgi:hypothetical protein